MLPSSPPHAFSSSPPYSLGGPPSSETMMDENITTAEPIIIKWAADHTHSSTSSYSLFNVENRQEGREFLRSVRDLQRSMHFYATHSSASRKLVHAQTLMEKAMRRLGKEFYQILVANREQMEPVDSMSTATTSSTLSDYEDEMGSELEEIQTAEGDSIQEAWTAMMDLRAIAECMISSGYGGECVKIYRIIRKSIVDEGIYRLGFDISISSSQTQKMEWETLEQKIKNWAQITKIAVHSLFRCERLLCDHVFASSPSIKESGFADITKEAAVQLLAFAESVAKCKKSPEKMFRFLDLYSTISDLWLDIETIFSFESTSAVRIQAVSSMVKLGQGIRAMLADFEAAIQKDNSRLPTAGCGLHPLTRYVMNYICLLSDYSELLADIFADFPFEIQSPLPDALLLNSPSPEEPFSAIATRLEWLVLILLCKLDGKAKLHKGVALAYLFLSNNLQYVVSKAGSCHLRKMLGDAWAVNQEAKVLQYAANYERAAWSKVAAALPENPTAEMMVAERARERFQDFNYAFETACMAQSEWVVPDGRLRERIKMSVTKSIVPSYRAFYDMYRGVLMRGENGRSPVRFAPEDLESYISNLFQWNGVSGSASGGSSSSSSSNVSR
ncbi:hypothetical protein ACLOJK_001651 [Asimina triloba]